jgi:hypothetical protein
VKRWKDMNEEERGYFIDLGSDVLTSMGKVPVPEGADDADLLIILVLMIKTYDRPLVNCALEFDVDRKNWVREAVRDARIFLDNTFSMNQEGDRRKIPKAVSDHISMLADPRFERIVDRYANVCLRGSRRRG